MIVLDAETGKFKRMWGAYGNQPDDAAPTVPVQRPRSAAIQLVHGVRVSDDGLVYVADRRNKRVQVFTVGGKFVREIFIERKTRLLGTAFSIAFSPGGQQRYLYLADAGNGLVHVFDRDSMSEVGRFGRIGQLRRAVRLPPQRRDRLAGQRLHGRSRQWPPRAEVPQALNNRA